ncbi:MAG: ADP-ribosylglycohydrolase family protein [Acinetobacter sp.]
MYLALEQKILGSLAGSAIGDAMGAATELLTEGEIIRRFGKSVDSFELPPKNNPYAGGRAAGQITDDSSLTFFLCNAYLQNHGLMTVELAAQTMLKWSESEYFPRFAGPATKNAVERLRKGENPLIVGRHGDISMGGTTNGAAMKISPAGLMHPGNLDASIEDAILICLPTHGTQIAMSGACAVACAVSSALCDAATVGSVLEAALYGAQRGETLGCERGRIAAGPSVIDRIKFAIQIVLGEDSSERACRKISRLIGTGLPIAEAVPAALGIFLAEQGDPMSAIKRGVNLGDDTDTVGCIVGAISGAYAGIDRVSASLYHQVDEINHLHLADMAKALVVLMK